MLSSANDSSIQAGARLYPDVYWPSDIDCPKCRTAGHSTFHRLGGYTGPYRLQDAVNWDTSELLAYMRRAYTVTSVASSGSAAFRGRSRNQLAVASMARASSMNESGQAGGGSLSSVLILSAAATSTAYVIVFILQRFLKPPVVCCGIKLWSTAIFPKWQGNDKDIV